MSEPAIDLTCQDVSELVTDYLSRALPAERAALFEAHVSECPPCTTYVQQVRSLVALASSLREPDAARPDEAKLLLAFRRRKAP